ncbi:MAG: hypothetical protein ACRC9R_02525 [Enterovibrio sp.]
MTKKSIVRWDDVRENLLSDPKVQKAYEDELRKERLQATTRRVAQERRLN